MQQEQVDGLRILDLVEGHNVTALDILVDGLRAEDLLDEVGDRHKIIHNRHHDLQLLDATNSNKPCCKDSNNAR